MFRLIITELKYHKIFFSSFLLGAMLISLLFRILPEIEDFPYSMVTFWFIFLTWQNWIVLRNKEKRIRFSVALPVPLYFVAFFRIAVLILLGVGISLISTIVFFISNGAALLQILKSWIPFCMWGVLFSIYYIIQDLLMNFLRNNRFFQLNPERSKTILMILVVILNLLGVYALTARPRMLGFFKHIVHFFKTNPLVTTETGILVFFVCTLLISGLTLFTFRIRKTYLD